ncbi:MAG TPA: acyltransferase [Rhizomicrobium sp.]|jgi:peptidoglycan/LPS O-acetylase OafA/YrhL
MAEARRFRALDGWRGICALLIALHHFPAQGFIYHLPLVRNSWLLVDFFFVLSGFVIAFAYGERLTHANEFRPFAIRRFFRLWPLHICVLAAFVGLELYRYAATGTGFTGERSLFALLTNLTLTQALGLHNFLTWNTPAWAMSTEFWTYIVFALTALLAGRWRNVAAVILIAASIAILALHSRYGMRETFDWGIARCIYGFFLGALTYEAWSRKWFARFSGSLAEIAALCVALVFLIVIPGDRPLEYLAPPVFAMFVLVFAADAGALSRLMAHPVFETSGRWSYAIYLVQMFVIASMASVLDLHAATGIEADALALLYVLCVLVLAALSWRFIEVPGQRLAIRNIPAQGTPTSSVPDTNR